MRIYIFVKGELMRPNNEFSIFSFIFYILEKYKIFPFSLLPSLFSLLSNGGSGPHSKLVIRQNSWIENRNILPSTANHISDLVGDSICLSKRLCTSCPENLRLSISRSFPKHVVRKRDSCASVNFSFSRWRSVVYLRREIFCNLY